ncbi:MAG: hypothetical protein WC966_03595 [Bradymonadales bacterium]|jgi:hypothetical protein
MKNRTVLILILSFVMFGIIALGSALALKLSKSKKRVQNAVTAADLKSFIQVGDRFANMESEAIALVQKHKVLDPEYVVEYLETLKAYEEAGRRERAGTKDPASVEIRWASILELVERAYLEKRFNMSFLSRGDWRALHLDPDLDAGTEQVPDPYYEVYLDYFDESVAVGPVWIVNVETGFVVPRNDMARVFDNTVRNYERSKELIDRPASVVRAIISHKFGSGIELGGVFLLYFLKLANTPGHEDDRIVGWTVAQDFKGNDGNDFYNAYFQWVEGKESRVAKFRFNWTNQSLEPRGLIAIDLMRAGENLSFLKNINILPEDYINNPNIPRRARWSAGACKGSDFVQLCTAFTMVLEQHEFINALQWLITNGESDVSSAFQKCKDDRVCKWNLIPAPDELNPDKSENLFKIGYQYDIGKGAKSINFLVNSETGSVVPLDKISQWAYWSVTPRT